MAAAATPIPDYWIEARQAGLWQNGQFRDRTAPRAYGEPFDLPNHPVVGVSWYEALGFCPLAGSACRERRHPAGRTPRESPQRTGMGESGQRRHRTACPAHVRPFKDLVVPTPALTPNPQPKRAYPWGEKADPELANYDETEIGSTSAVGAFAAGASPYGVEELSGNVWEWTRSLWGETANRLPLSLPHR